MPGCPNGARPKPGYTGTNMVLDASKTVLSDVVGAVTGLWGEIAVQPLLGRVNVDNLCALNLVDPGPPTNDDLVALSAMLAPFGSMQTATNVPTWFFNQVQYQAFVDACECITVGETIPPRQTVSIPPWAEPWPTDPDKQPQIDRIERGLQTSADGMRQVYNGVQRVDSLLGELWVRSVPNLISNPIMLKSSATGEGCVELPIDTSSSARPFSTYVTYLQVRCNSIPANAGIRGSLVPRLYGVGSLYFDTAMTSSSPKNIGRRESIHYWHQVVQLPERMQTYRVCWRLMPGANVDLLAYGSATDNVQFAFSGAAEYGWIPLHNEPSPPNFYDPPMYDPNAQRRQFALGGVP